MSAHKVWRKAFLASLAECGNVRAAAQAANVDPKTCYNNRKDDPEFAAEWQAALDLAADVLEEEAWRRAHKGVGEPVFYKGEICGTVQKYSDLLLMFLLKGLRPEKFREKVYVSTAQLDQMIEGELKVLRGEEEAEPTEAVN
ncbi:MAG: hypothetical protein ACR2HX_19430 [Pyrinomonadaceae bacterium]